MEQNNSSSGDDALFFKIYRAFLEVDSINSFTQGRNRHLIKDFYHLYNINRTTYEPPLETLKDIRKKEYLGIGSDERLFKEYREFTQKLIDSI